MNNYENKLVNSQNFNARVGRPFDADFGEAQSTAPMNRDMEIPASLHRLDDAIEHLSISMGALRERMLPVSSVSPPRKEGNEVPPPSRTAIGNQLAESERRVRAAACMVDDLLTSLEI